LSLYHASCSTFRYVSNPSAILLQSQPSPVSQQTATPLSSFFVADDPPASPHSPVSLVIDEVPPNWPPNVRKICFALQPKVFSGPPDSLKVQLFCPWPEESCHLGCLLVNLVFLGPVRFTVAVVSRPSALPEFFFFGSFRSRDNRSLLLHCPQPSYGALVTASVIKGQPLGCSFH